MAVYNPHFVDDETGAVFVLDESGWVMVAQRYSRADIRGLNIDELRLIHELLMELRSDPTVVVPNRIAITDGILAKIELTPYADN